MQRLPMLLWLLVTTAACGSDAGAGADVELPASCSRFLLFDNEDWELKEAVDYPQDLGPLGEVDPGMDWYSEFERFTPLEDGTGEQGLYLRLTGYSVALKEILTGRMSRIWASTSLMADRYSRAKRLMARCPLWRGP